MEKLCPFLIFSSVLIVGTISISTEECDDAAGNWIENFNARNKTPDLTFKFYVQDALSGPRATVWEVARASITSKSRTNFGQVRVMDNLITSGPDRKSQTLGQAQGITAFSDLKDAAMVVNFVSMFNGGLYKGSSLYALGRFPFSRSRELVVTGGTGVFRMARGYVTSKTYNSTSVGNQTTYAIMEYTVSLYHPW